MPSIIMHFEMFPVLSKHLQSVFKSKECKSEQGACVLTIFHVYFQKRVWLLFQVKQLKKLLRSRLCVYVCGPTLSDSIDTQVVRYCLLASLLHFLWIHSYLWGPVFVDCQHFAGLLDVILWATDLLHYNARQFITLLNVCEDSNPWVRVTHEIHKH